MKRKTRDHKDKDEEPKSKKAKIQKEEEPTFDIELPKDVWAKVFDHLLLHDGYNLQYVSKTFHEIYHAAQLKRVEGVFISHKELLEQNKEKIVEKYHELLLKERPPNTYFIPQTAVQIGLEVILQQIDGKTKFLQIKEKKTPPAPKLGKKYTAKQLESALHHVFVKNITNIPYFYYQTWEIATVYKNCVEFQLQPFESSEKKKVTLKIAYHTGWNGKKEMLEGSFSVIVNVEDEALRKYLLDIPNYQKDGKNQDKNFTDTNDTGRPLVFYLSTSGELDEDYFYSNHRLVQLITLLLHQILPTESEEAIKEKLATMKTPALYEILLTSLFSALATHNDGGKEYANFKKEFALELEDIIATISGISDENLVGLPITLWKNHYAEVQGNFPYPWSRDFSLEVAGESQQENSEEIIIKLNFLDRFKNFTLKHFTNEIKFERAAGVVLVSNLEQPEKSTASKSEDSQEKLLLHCQPLLESFVPDKIKKNPLCDERVKKLVNFCESTSNHLAIGQNSSMKGIRGDIYFNLSKEFTQNGVVGDDFVKIHYSFENYSVTGGDAIIYCILALETSNKELRKKLKMKTGQKVVYLISDKNKSVRFDGVTVKPKRKPAPKKSVEAKKDETSEKEEKEEVYPAEDLDFEGAEKDEEKEETDKKEDETKSDEKDGEKKEKEENGKEATVDKFNGDNAFYMSQCLGTRGFLDNYLNEPALLEVFHFLRAASGDQRKIKSDTLTRKALNKFFIRWLLQFCEFVLQQSTSYYTTVSNDI